MISGGEPVLDLSPAGFEMILTQWEKIQILFWPLLNWHRVLHPSRTAQPLRRDGPLVGPLLVLDPR